MLKTRFPSLQNNCRVKVMTSKMNSDFEYTALINTYIIRKNIQSKTNVHISGNKILRSEILFPV